MLAAERSGIVAAIAQPGEAVDAEQDVARLRDAVLKRASPSPSREAANDIDIRLAQKPRSWPS